MQGTCYSAWAAQVEFCTREGTHVNVQYVHLYTYGYKQSRTLGALRIGRALRKRTYTRKRAIGTPAHVRVQAPTYYLGAAFRLSKYKHSCKHSCTLHAPFRVPNTVQIQVQAVTYTTCTVSAVHVKHCTRTNPSSHVHYIHCSGYPCQILYKYNYKHSRTLRARCTV